MLLENKIKQLRQDWKNGVRNKEIILMQVRVCEIGIKFRDIKKGKKTEENKLRFEEIKKIFD